MVHEVAYVEYLLSTGKKDKETDCLKLVWESATERYKLVELNNIKKIVHIVPTFRTDDSEDEIYLLNDYLFR